ncbi:MAG: M24 family metallopeptidase [Candidatus Aminicenantia bacterium]
MTLHRRNFLKLSLFTLLSSYSGKSILEGEEKERKFRKPFTGKIIPITDEERKRRISLAKELMARNKIGCILISPGSSLKYFTNINWGRSERFFALLLPQRGEPAFICPSFEKKRLMEQLKEARDIRTWEEDENPHKLVHQFLKERKIATSNFGIEETVRFFVVNGITKEAPALNIVSADPVTHWCRGIKSSLELNLMRIANEITINAFREALKDLSPGMTARKLRQKIPSIFSKWGFSGGAMVLFGENSAYPHGGRMKETVLKEGTIILIDGGTSVEGYRSDITRTIVFGNPTDKQKKVWEIVKKAQAAALKAARPGVFAGEVDQAARKVIENAGFSPGYKYFTHRLGHGIGLDGHEWPYLVRGNPLKLSPGMTFSNEPGIYIYGEFGVRLEDIMYITEDGAKLFTTQSFSLEHPFN